MDPKVGSKITNNNGQILQEVIVKISFQNHKFLGPENVKTVF